jgi:DNA repair exonuclease SbcCD nuclease subunit
MKNNQMINKIVHFSDLHIRLFKDHDLYKKILVDAFEQWKQIAPDRIVFTGDLVHSKNQLTPELVEIASWVLMECAKIAKTILIAGNHDALINNNDRLDSLTPIISNLSNPNIIYYKDRGIYEDENVSWCVYSQFQGNIPPEIGTAQGFKIGLFHDPVAGLTTDLGYDFGSHAYDIDKFSGLDIVLCGDVHKRSLFNIPNGKRGVMIGSTIQQNYGESINKHGYGVYEIDNDTYTFVDLSNPKPFLSFKINSIEDLVDGTERLVNA